MAAKPFLLVGDKVCSKNVDLGDDDFDVGTVVDGGGDFVRVWWTLAEAKYTEAVEALRLATASEVNAVAFFERQPVTVERRGLPPGVPDLPARKE